MKIEVRTKDGMYLGNFTYESGHEFARAIMGDVTLEREYVGGCWVRLMLKGNTILHVDSRTAGLMLEALVLLMPEMRVAAPATAVLQRAADVRVLDDAMRFESVPGREGVGFAREAVARAPLVSDDLVSVAPGNHEHEQRTTSTPNLTSLAGLVESVLKLEKANEAQRAAIEKIDAEMVARDVALTEVVEARTAKLDERIASLENAKEVQHTAIVNLDRSIQSNMRSILASPASGSK